MPPQSAFENALVCHSKGVFLIVMKVGTIILLKELPVVKQRTMEMEMRARGVARGQEA